MNRCRNYSNKQNSSHYQTAKICQYHFPYWRLITPCVIDLIGAFLLIGVKMTSSVALNLFYCNTLAI